MLLVLNLRETALINWSIETLTQKLINLKSMSATALMKRIPLIKFPERLVQAITQNVPASPLSKENGDKKPQPVYAKQQRRALSIAEIDGISVI